MRPGKIATGVPKQEQDKNKALKFAKNFYEDLIIRQRQGLAISKRGTFESVAAMYLKSHAAQFARGEVTKITHDNTEYRLFGTVIPFFRELARNGKPLPITDLRMTRFWMTLSQGVEFVIKTFHRMKGGEIFVPKLRSYSIIDLKDALIDLIGESAEAKIPIRPGEKMHEILINDDEIRYSWEYRNKYIIFSPTKDEREIEGEYKNIKRFEHSGQYYSGGVAKISKDELKVMIKNLGLF